MERARDRGRRNQLKWPSMNSVRTSLILRVLWWTLRALRASNRELLPHSVHTLSKHDFTVVIWPTRDERILLRLRATARTNTVKLSTLLSPLWRLLRMLVTRGNSGAAGGTARTPFISNSLAHPNAHGNGAARQNKSPDS